MEVSKDNVEYKCRAENEAGVASCSATLQLVKSTKIQKTRSRDVLRSHHKTKGGSLGSKPPVFVKKPNDLTVQEGFSAQFEATVIGNVNENDILWYHG